MNSGRKNYPMKEFQAIFPISSILVIRSGYAKKDHFSILAVIQNIWDLHKFGLQIWIQKAKITLWNNLWQFSWFHRFWSSGPGINLKKNGIYINLGCRFEFRTQKITLWKNFGQFFSISSILVIRSGYAKKDHISILAVIQKIWDLHKFGLQIWIQNAKITIWNNFGQFFQFHRFWSSGPGMQKKITSQY